MLSKQEAIDAITKGSDDTKWVVRTNAEDEQFQAVREDALIKKKTGEIHSQYDVDIFEASGIEKEAGEKTYNYNKRVLSMLKESSNNEALKDEIKDLKSKLENKGDDLSKKEIASLKTALKEAQTELKDKLAAKDKEFLGLEVKNEIERAKGKLKFRSDIPDAARDALVNTVVNELISSAQKNEDGIVFFDKDGNMLISKQDGSPLTPDNLLTSKLDPIIDKGKVQNGNGDKPKPAERDGSPVMPSTVQDPNGLTDWIRSLGHPAGSKEHQDLYNKYRPELSDK